MTMLSSRGFNGASSLLRVHFPSVKTADLAALTGVASLTTAIFDSLTSVSASMFSSCSNLTIVVLKRNSLVSLSNISAFNGTPFASGGTGGKVYVPQELVEQYQKATNWSVLYEAGTCEFVAIEGSEYE